MAIMAIFDIGGTGVQYQIFNNDKLTFEDEFAVTNQNRKQVIIQISNIIKHHQATSVGLSSPGAVNSQTGFISGLTGIEDYHDFNLYDALKTHNDQIKNIVAMNDANAALYGNVTLYPVANAVQITIGTGIGGAILINGKIYEGKSGFGGEFGYAPLAKNTSRSRVLSTKALVDQVNHKTNNQFANAKMVMRNLTKSEIKHLYEAWITNIAFYIIDLEYTFDPDIIFIAGGIAQNNQFQTDLQKKVITTLQQYQYPNQPQIKYSSDQNIALIGIRNLLVKNSKK